MTRLDQTAASVLALGLALTACSGETEAADGAGVAATASATGQAPPSVAAHGAPEDSPDFWRRVSPRPYFGAITEPILIQHGTADESCPYEWSVAFFREHLT